MTEMNSLSLFGQFFFDNEVYSRKENKGNQKGNTPMEKEGLR